MKIKVAWIGKTKEPAIQSLTDEYVKRISRYAEIAGLALKDEAAILSLAKGDGRQSAGRRSKDRHKLPHELARVVLVEQIYRAFTILKNHPYHLGH